ncbi:MAG: helix-turn-helix domain-containing protein, partial [Smithellaceae bacterium]
ADIRNYKHSDAIILPKIQAKTPTGMEEVVNALNRTGWNKAKAARLLGICRQTIYRKIGEYHLNKESRV